MAARVGAMRYDAAGEAQVFAPSGRWVKAEGRVGKQVIASERRAMNAARDEARAQANLIPLLAAGPAQRQLAVAPRGDVRELALRRFGAFREQMFEIRGAQPRDLITFARTIYNTAERYRDNFKSVIIRALTPGRERPEARTLLIEPIRDIGTPRALPAERVINYIARQLADMQQQVDDVHGSDGFTQGSQLIVDSFTVGYTRRPVGASIKFTGISKTTGSKHPHFALLEFSGKLDPAKGDCLFAVLRAVNGALKLEKPAGQNSTIRQRLNIPPGPIAATPELIDRLAREFNLFVQIITGMCVPVDTERVFDDDAARPHLRNRCTTKAEPVIIASGGDPEHPLCEVYLDVEKRHYEFIARILAPITTCPVTGDLVETPYTPDELRTRVTQQGRPWFGLAAEPARPARYQERVIVYDYETTYDVYGQLEPYSLGYYIFTPSHNSDFSAEEPRVTLSYGATPHEVTQPLLDEIARAPDDVRYTLVSFNGCRFDHFLLARAAIESNMLTGVFATAGGGLRTLLIGLRHSTLDLAKLIPGTSLANACASFVTSPKKLEGFSHTLVQQARERGELQSWLHQNKAACNRYLALDVLSTASLFTKLRKAFIDTTACDILTHSGNALVYQTIGGIAWKYMTNVCAIPRAVESQARDIQIRSGIVGGRTQVYREPGAPAQPVRLDEPLRMVDFASLYPTVMAAVPKNNIWPENFKWGCYPTGNTAGEPIEVTSEVAEELLTAGTVGLFEVTITRQPWPVIIPNRVEGEPLDWAHQTSVENPIKTRITHIDLHLIRRACGADAVQIHSALIWPTTSNELFRPFVNALAALKDAEDVKKSAKDASYNPAMREVLKLLLNSASGKCAQNNYDEQCVLATGAPAQLAAEAKMDQSKPIQYIPIGGTSCLVLGSKPSESVYKKTAKPSILAVLIYSYSRALVWSTLCQHNVLYSDTDSGLFRQADYERLREQFPQLDPKGRSKALGDLEEELGSYASSSALLMAAKDYAVVLRDAAGEISSKSKIKVKGLCMHRDRLIVDEAAHGRLTALLEESQASPALTEAYSTACRDLSAPLSDPKIAVRVFEKRCAGERAHILCSQLTRSYKDYGAAPFALEQVFMIKAL
jgi:hypothetical protein